MDFKKAASGERPSERNEIEKPENNSKERVLAEQALEFLLTFTQASLNAEERRLWIKRLSKVPPWKLMRLADFTSGHLRDVWKFFDELRPAPETFRAQKVLPNPENNIAEECRAYTGRLLADGLSSAERDKIELDFVLAMREKYPHLVWACGRKNNQGS